MSASRAARDVWLQTFALIAALSAGLWALDHRVSFAPEPPAEPAAEPPAPSPAPARPGRKRPRNGREWIVDPGGSADADAETLSAAVAAASAGDTIRLRPGLYHDSVVVDRVLKILGSGTKGQTALLAKGKFVLSIRSAAVTLADVSLSADASPAIEILDRGWLELARSAVTGGDSGAVIVESRGSLITDETDFTAGRAGRAIAAADGSVKLKGGVFRGGKTQVALSGDDASLEADGVSFEDAETAVAAPGRARVALTNCRFENVKNRRREDP